MTNPQVSQMLIALNHRPDEEGIKTGDTGILACAPQDDTSESPPGRRGD